MFKAHIKLWVLKELENKEGSGYELMKRIDKLAGKTPSPGYIYPLLIGLHKKGLLSARTKGRKRIYAITKKGKRFLATLTKNKEKSMRMMMKNFEPLAEKSEMRQFSMFFKIMQKDRDFLIRDSDLWNEFRHVLFRLYAKDYEKKRRDIRKILKGAIKELKEIA